MKYVKTNSSGEVEKYPYTIREFRKDFPAVLIRDNPPADTLAEYGVYLVSSTPKPEAPLGQQVVSSTPRFNNGEWVEQWAFEPAPTPTVVSMRQARLALLSEGLLDDVTEVLEAITDVTARRAAQIEWEYATEVQRQSPLITQLGTSLGLSDEQIDDLFVLASSR